MSLYSVYARDADVPVAIADRFSWFAALLPPVFAIAHRLWLLLGAWVLAVVAIAGFAVWGGADVAFWLYVLVAAYIGLEAAGFRRRRMDRIGFAYRTDILAADEDFALMTFLRSRGGQ